MPLSINIKHSISLKTTMNGMFTDKIIEGVQMKEIEMEKDRLQEQLSRHLYCRNCEFAGLASSFPVKGSQDAIDEKQYCPQCFGSEIVKIILCSRCGDTPAEGEDSWCASCLVDYQDRQAALREDMDLEDD